MTVLVLSQIAALPGLSIAIALALAVKGVTQGRSEPLERLLMASVNADSNPRNHVSLIWILTFGLSTAQSQG